MKTVFRAALFFICIFICRPAKAQLPHAFRMTIKARNLFFAAPKGFVAVKDSLRYNSFFQYDPNMRKRYLYPLDYEIVNRDSSIVIGFRSYMLQPELDTAKLFKKIFPGRSVNSEYQLMIKQIADSINYKINVYTKEECMRLFKADIAGDFTFNLERRYWGRFSRCSIVFIHKKDTIDMVVHYFYNELNKEEAAKLILETSKMLHFN